MRSGCRGDVVYSDNIDDGKDGREGNGLIMRRDMTFRTPKQHDFACVHTETRNDDKQTINIPF